MHSSAMKICGVASCRKDSSNNPGVTFFNLPRDPCAKSEWLDALGIKRNEISSQIKVCEAHFKAKDFCAGKKQLKIHAVPVLNLGVNKSEPLDSEDEFMHCDSDNDDILLEVKKKTAAEAMMNRKVKEEPEEEPEPETRRRPSRRAAQVAAKKIYNTVCNYGLSADTDEPEVISTITPKTASTPSPKVKAQQRPRQRSYQNIKIPPPNIGLVMECHEELLSTVQAEALLQSQLQYNMVMKTLRNLKASSNVKIIVQPAGEPPVIKSDDEDDLDVKNESDVSVSNTKELDKASVQHDKNKNGSIYPTELKASIESPKPSILS